MSEELGTIDEKASVPLALRDEDGTVRADYVERVAQAIEAKIRRRCAIWSATCTRPTSAT